MNDNQLHRLNRGWLVIFAVCEPSDLLLRALENLDIAQLCTRLQADPEFHLGCHFALLQPDHFKGILDWLWTCRICVGYLFSLFISPLAVSFTTVPGYQILGTPAGYSRDLLSNAYRRQIRAIEWRRVGQLRLTLNLPKPAPHFPPVVSRQIILYSVLTTYSESPERE
ncbi:hypothetical protein DFH06DRAFT_393700 [Mycena polygramma]|nr:hypothetical protein DFH06DRAFT_393700 [Mycena polygramma]